MNLVEVNCKGGVFMCEPDSERARFLRQAHYAWLTGQHGLERDLWALALASGSAPSVTADEVYIQDCLEDNYYV